MTKEELKKKFDESCLKIMNAHSPEAMNAMFLSRVYTLMFNEFPHIITFDNDGYYLNKEVLKNEISNSDSDDEYTETDDEDEVYTYKNILVQHTNIKLVEKFKDSAYIIRKDDVPLIIGDKFIIYYYCYDRCFYFLYNDAIIPDFIQECIVDEESQDNGVRWISYVTNTGQGFNETSMKVKSQDIDLEMNYNDDLPHDKIVEFLKSNQSGLLLLYGIPGSGKTSYIRHLMYTIKGRNFIVLDASTFHYITDASFIDLLLMNRNSVIILEDCEDMLADRVTGNAQLATLLNLSDGIIGDSFNFKFICTFNANISKLDKAILRKGRLKQKYEFKALTPEKTKALAQKLGQDVPDGKSLTLAEIFNYDQDNGQKEDKKIGFSK